MKFVVKIPTGSNINAMRAKLIRNARRMIIFYRFGAAEQELDNYLRKNYKTPLRYFCLKIVFESDFMTDYDDNLIISQRDPKLDDIARLITFGDGKMQGSRILKRAFGIK